MLFGRSAEHTRIALLDDAVSGGKAVDDGRAVAGKNRSGGSEGRFEDVFAQQRSADKAVDTIRSIIRMERDDSVELLTSDSPRGRESPARTNCARIRG